jgi:hypothetical protein
MNDFDYYAALLARWAAAYVSAAYSYIGFKNAEGFHLFCGRVFFGTALSATPKETFSFETENIVAGRFSKISGANGFLAAIADAKAGKITGINDVIMSLVPDNNRLNEFVSKIYPPLIASLRITGLSRFNLTSKLNLPRDLDLQLKSADVPFDTMDDLLNHCGLPNLTQIGDSTFLEIVAPSPGIIDTRSTISKGEAIIECRVSKALDTSKLILGYRIFNEDQSINRASITGNTLKWHEENGLVVGTFRTRLEKASLLQVYLSYDRIPLDQKSIIDPKKHPGPHHAAYQAFDPNFESIKEILLKRDKTKSDVFESAVSVLLTLLGFSSANYGRIPKLQDGADIIAVTPSGRMAIVECTVGLPNQNDKLAKLVQRTTIIRKNMTDAGINLLDVLPVIVAWRPKEEMAVDIPLAGEHGIAVVSIENIEDWLNRVALPPNGDKIFDEIRKLVPPTERFLSLGFE